MRFIFPLFQTQVTITRDSWDYISFWINVTSTMLLGVFTLYFLNKQAKISKQQTRFTQQQDANDKQKILLTAYNNFKNEVFTLNEIKNGFVDSLMYVETLTQINTNLSQIDAFNKLSKLFLSKN